MELNKKKYSIKIPNNNTILYCIKKNIITIIGPLARKSVKLKLKINIFEDLKIIQVSSIPLINLSNNKKKNISALRGTTTAIIKQLILETSSILYQKLKLIGVGYKVFERETLNNKILMFRLGYSHPIFFKTTENLKFYCLKFTKLFIYGNSYQNITQAASLIKSHRAPEPYKGKGILYSNEIIKLKKGKKNLK